MTAKKPGRPRNIKVKVSKLLDHLNALPSNSPIKTQLTPDKMICIERYLEELVHLEALIKRLKLDIWSYGEIEEFVQGAQRLRRANPSLEAYFSALRAYRALLNKVNEIIHGVEVIW